VLGLRNTRLYKAEGFFTIGAGFAAIGGVLFATGWTDHADVFSLYNAALTIIWVDRGRTRTLIGRLVLRFRCSNLTSALGGAKSL